MKQLVTVAVLAALTLLNCQAEVELLDRQIELILATQCDDGSWPRIAFYSGPRPPLPRWCTFSNRTVSGDNSFSSPPPWCSQAR